MRTYVMGALLLDKVSRGRNLKRIFFSAKTFVVGATLLIYN